jgi:uncharacterized protein
MNCPSCKSSPLSISERKGIEIDFCPTCRGIWLERGELDKIIERTNEELTHGARAEEKRQPQEDRNYHQQRSVYSEKPFYKKKKSFLEELFD